MKERVRMFAAERDGSVYGGPDGPVPVQCGDIVVVYVAKSWSDAAEKLRKVASGDPR